ncbi:polyphosphate polymerase domain-containing protein [Aquimarina sp. RZ0]|uniref:polyphosphate polymerase domain-containing protein n=1 Tax=Aquimarina sp. RZ0 TaxID=2607730 RepID=UPI0011F22354|nr:polyphosphate polymerase domain-containing protein [Aquimarina sp. RZ0]KAA1245497.1 polyphosphate polymerase domain-containing protein [Aquimarina sp. RZ0]
MKVNVLEDFEPIALDQMDQVRLMNRVDLKYYFDKRQLSEIISKLSQNYYILTIDKKRIFSYKTVYYDTATHDFYLAHHNNKLNRLKIRKRTYIDTNTSFMELKIKNNKGRTLKKRIQTTIAITLSEDEKKYITTHANIDSDNLAPSLTNTFKRITLVNKTLDERCTIDLDICFTGKDKASDLKNIVVLEIKTAKKNGNTAITKLLKENRIKQAGFSKYCIGKLTTTTGLKYNRFKQQLREINKLNTYAIYK